MFGFILFKRALVAVALKLPFVLSFALPVILLPWALRQWILFGHPKITPDLQLGAFASYLIDLLLLSVLAIAWCRSLLMPKRFPRPLVAIRAEPIGRFLFHVLFLIIAAVAFVRGGLELCSLLLPQDWLRALAFMNNELEFAPRALAPMLLFWGALMAGVSLPGVAVFRHAPLWPSLRFGPRHGHWAFQVSLCLVMLNQAIIIAGIIALFGPEQFDSALALFNPRMFTPGLMPIPDTASIILFKLVLRIGFGLSFLVALGALCGMYKAWQEAAAPPGGKAHHRRTSRPA